MQLHRARVALPSKILTPLLPFAFLLLWGGLGMAQEKREAPATPEEILARWILCDTELPLYSDKEHKPVWLNPQQLKRRAIHCEAPKPIPIARTARVNGKVGIAILLNSDGKVECVKLISGHPLLTGASLEAVKKWKFAPYKVNGKPLAFCGLVEFHFATGSADHKPDPCLCVHW